MAYSRTSRLEIDITIRKYHYKGADAMLELKALFTSEIKKARNEGRQDFIDQVNLDDYKDCDCECHNFKKGKE